jgi:hypothetical protein
MPPKQADQARTGRWRTALSAARSQLLILVATLAVIELMLRFFNPQYLRDEAKPDYGFRYDGELGWYPLPHPPMHNSLGLRDIEYVPDARPKMLFLGDSLTWGLGVQNGERATDLLRKDLPGYQIINAGVSGYGTDQEYLLLQRLWDKFVPDIVVITFTCYNDRIDNSRNVRYSTYKPYFEMLPDGGLRLHGQPAPRARRLYFRDTWLGRNAMIARLAISAYVEVRYPRVVVADPTERLVAAIQDFVKARGARLLFGLQDAEPALEAYLRARKIPYTRFDDAEVDKTRHWTPKGHRQVAQRYLKFFSEVGIPPSAQHTPKRSSRS